MTQIEVGKLNKIAAFSEEYRRLIEKEGLAFNKAGGSWKTVRKDWWSAFLFFLDQAYYTGRRDELSQRFERAAVQALESVLVGQTSEERLLALKGLIQWLQPSQQDKPGNPFREALDKKYNIGAKERSGTGRGRDKEMVQDALRFATEDCEFNILECSVKLICRGNIGDLYRRLDKIVGVGPKVASLFLSTTVFIYELDSYLQPTDYEYVVPIDRWVRRIADTLGIRTDSKSIAKVCQDNGISPIKFEQGVWYLGSHSLEVVLRTL